MSLTCKPYVICHILTSIDGRISGSFMGAAEASPAIRTYRELQDAYEADAIAYGAATAKGVAGSHAPKLPASPATLEKDYAAPNARKPYYLALDPIGELAWSSSTTLRPNGATAHIVEVLGEKAPLAYRAYLQKRGISYVTAGKESLDLACAVEKIGRIFGIEKLLVCGGGITDETFLQAGLIDELSVVVAPVASGQSRAATLFDESEFAPAAKPVGFELARVDVLAGDALHVVYRRPGSGTSHVTEDQR